MYRLTLRRIALGIVFFVVLYFEDLAVGNLTVGQIWKFPFFLYALLYVLMKNRAAGERMPGYLAVGLLLAAKIALNVSFPKGILQDLAEAVYTLTLPLSIAFFAIAFKNARRKLIDLLISLSLFFIVSNIPFLFGFLAQRRSVTSLARFGLEEQTALSGLFFNISTTSKILVVSVIIWIAARKSFDRTPIWRLFHGCVFALGVFSVYRAYTRTGWLMLIAGLFLLFLLGSNLRKAVFILLPLTAAIGFIVVSEVRDNQALSMRLRGETVYRQNEGNDLNLIMSFRLDLYRYSIENITGAGPAALAFGYGKTQSVELMEGSLGRGQISHNRFLELLQYGGVAALILYAWFLWRLYRLIRTIPRRNSELFARLPFVLFILLGMSVLPSHGFPIWADLLFGGAVAAGLIGSGADDRFASRPRVRS